VKIHPVKLLFDESNPERQYPLFYQNFSFRFNGAHSLRGQYSDTDIAPPEITSQMSNTTARSTGPAMIFGRATMYWDGKRLILPKRESRSGSRASSGRQSESPARQGKYPTSGPRSESQSGSGPRAPFRRQSESPARQGKSSTPVRHSQSPPRQDKISPHSGDLRHALASMSLGGHSSLSGGPADLQDSSRKGGHSSLATKSRDVYEPSKKSSHSSSNNSRSADPRNVFETSHQIGRSSSSLPYSKNPRDSHRNLKIRPLGN
jgi:hypothetical protein